MHIDSSIKAVSWIPAGSVTGLARVPFSLGLTRYDDPPPARIEDLDAAQVSGSIREVNRLKAWIEVRDERIVDAGYGGPGGFVGSTRLDLGFTEVQVPGRARPLLRRSLHGTSTAWTTLMLTLYADGRKDAWLFGASPFPRHYLYDDEGYLIGQTTDTNFGNWFSKYYGAATPWGGRDLEPLGLEESVPQVERAVA